VERALCTLWPSCGSVSVSIIVTGGKDSAHEVEWALKIRNQFDVEDHLASLSLEWNRLVGRIHGGAAIRLGATILGDDTIAQQTVKTN
jgi:hypothetical protein